MKAAVITFMWAVIHDINAWLFLACLAQDEKDFSILGMMDLGANPYDEDRYNKIALSETGTWFAICDFPDGFYAIKEEMPSQFRM